MIAPASSAGQGGALCYTSVTENPFPAAGPRLADGGLMRSLKSLSLLLACALLAAGAPSLRAQTTGSITGAVKDEGGGALPGVTVEAKSPSLQGSRVTVTDGAGIYRLTLLPPGTYTVSFTLEGFAADTR